MTDEEIASLLKSTTAETIRAVESIAAKAAGQLQAVTVVLRAMQYQPTFQRDLFVETVAAYQARIERDGALPPEVREAFARALEAICMSR